MCFRYNEVSSHRDAFFSIYLVFIPTVLVGMTEILSALW